MPETRRTGVVDFGFWILDFGLADGRFELVAVPGNPGRVSVVPPGLGFCLARLPALKCWARFTASLRDGRPVGTCRTDASEETGNPGSEISAPGVRPRRRATSAPTRASSGA